MEIQFYSSVYDYPVFSKPFIEETRKLQPTLVFFLGESHLTEEPGKLQSMGSQRFTHD